MRGFVKCINFMCLLTQFISKTFGLIRNFGLFLVVAIEAKLEKHTIRFWVKLSVKM